MDDALQEILLGQIASLTQSNERLQRNLERERALTSKLLGDLDDAVATQAEMAETMERQHKAIEAARREFARDADAWRSLRSPSMN